MSCVRASRSQQEAGELIPGSRSAATRPPVGWAELPPAHAPAFCEEGVSGIPGGAWSAIGAEGPQEGCLESRKHASTLLHPAGQLTGLGTLSRPLVLCVHMCTLGQPGSRAVRSRCGCTTSAPSQMSLGPSQVVHLFPKAEEPKGCFVPQW